MRRLSLEATVLLLCAGSALAQSAPSASTRPAQKPAGMQIGDRARDFALPGVDDKTWRLADFASARILLMIFTCNHCPTAQAYESRIKELVTQYGPRGVATVAISPNDPQSVRLDELGYTDLSDSFEEMKIRAKQQQFNFPYLYDGDRQEVSRAYGPSATPTAFVFDADRKLRYMGRIDDSTRPERVRRHDLRAALDALLAGERVPVEKTPAVGCSVKWNDKRDTVVQAMKKLAAEPVSLETADEAGIRALAANKTDKLRLVNVWATWCGPCRVEFPELVTISRMYRHRGLEFVSISGDFLTNKKAALAFLQSQQASNKNVLFDTDQDTFVQAIDPQWNGALPYTMLIRPGGEVVYRHQGPLEPLELRRQIVQQLGRLE